MDVDNAGDKSQTKTGTHSETMIQDEEVTAYSDPVTPEFDIRKRAVLDLPYSAAEATILILARNWHTTTGFLESTGRMNVMTSRMKEAMFYIRMRDWITGHAMEVGTGDNPNTLSFLNVRNYEQDMPGFICRAE
ncbi:hypothetical protein BJX62DRAFT_239497 [Aspergillus germanicus]